MPDFIALNVQQLHHGFAVRSPLKRLRNRDRMCKCNTVTRDDIPFAICQGFAPTPRISAYVLNVVSGSLPLPRPLAH
uniref:Uncharacterized protein n=1 Tax=Escherichia coli TaxID=562 RepID=A0A3G4RXH2_ECOLX|nr:hypothetical protein D0362_00132 [Escherichia coli]